MTATQIAELLGGSFDGVVYTPAIPETSFAPRRHAARSCRFQVIAITLDPEAPVVYLLACRDCGNTEAVTPRRRLRKLRPGFTTEQWLAVIEENERRIAEAKARAV